MIFLWNSEALKALKMLTLKQKSHFQLVGSLLAHKGKGPELSMLWITVSLQKSVFSVNIRMLKTKSASCFPPLGKAETRFWCCCWVQNRERNNVKLLSQKECTIHFQLWACIFFSYINNWVTDFSLSMQEESAPERLSYLLKFHN